MSANKKKSVSVSSNELLPCDACSGYFRGSGGLKTHQRSCNAFKAKTKAEIERLKQSVEENDDDDVDELSEDEVKQVLSTPVKVKSVNQPSMNRPNFDVNQIDDIDSLKLLVNRLAITVNNLADRVDHLTSIGNNSMMDDDDDLTTHTFGNLTTQTSGTNSSKLNSPFTAHVKELPTGVTPSPKATNVNFKLTPFGWFPIDTDYDGDVIYSEVYRTPKKALYYTDKTHKPVYITNRPDLIEKVAKNPKHPEHNGSV